MRDDVNWHEVEACVGSEFVYIVIALAAAVFHSCLLLGPKAPSLKLQTVFFF